MKKVDIGDFKEIAKLSGLTLSPSGKKAAFTVQRGDAEGKGYQTDIWVYDGERLFRLTAGEDGKSPLFEDEEHILFPADRKGRHKPTSAGVSTVFNRISLRGGEAEEAFVLPFAASDITFLPDGGFLCCGGRDIRVPDMSGLSDDEKAKKIKELDEEKDYEVFDELPFWFNGRGVINKKRRGLFRCGKDGAEKCLLTELYLDVHGFVLAGDGDTVAVWGCQFESLNTQESELFLLSLSTGERRDIALPAHFRVEEAQYVEGSLIVLGTDGAVYGSSENPAMWRVEDGKLAFIANNDPSLGAVGSDIAGGGSDWSAPDALRYVRTIGYRSVYEKTTADGKSTVLCDEIPCVSAAAGRDDDFFVIGMEKDRPQELYRKVNGEFKKLSAFNEAYVAEHEIAQTEHFNFTDRDGVELDGWVLKPADFEAGKKYPAVLDVHGGPQTAYGEGFFHEMQYWAAKGYIVFFCNPRGSSGRGGAFADIYGENYGVRDFNDLMDFTDEVLRRVPEIDEKRVCMTGGSYGGFMANWIVGHTDRFCAVASQRSISNYLSKCLTTDIGYYHNLSAIQADPWTSMDKMWRHSPLAYADRAVTPTLFIQSDEDYRCWMGDAIQMLQALLMHGVPARMCLFHGENHELSRSGKPHHRIRRLREITEWFDRYAGRE